jgi:hypothetical protein
MKKTLPFLIFLAASFPHIFNAQCSGCTSTLSGTSIITFHDKTVNDGETYCISSSGDLKRGLHIQSGGTVCNNGTISGFIEIFEGGTLINNGTIEAKNIMFRGGEITNNGIINSESIWMEKGNFNNYNIANLDVITIQIMDTGSYLNNEGIINCKTTQSHSTDLIYSYNIYNSGEFHCSSKLSNSSVVTFENSGNISIGDAVNNTSIYPSLYVNFQNSSNATFINTGQMEVVGNFTNYGNFYTDCMIPIGGNFRSHGNITGPLQNTCGGFNVAGLTQLAGGYVGTDFSFIDICDAGNPVNGIDSYGPMGIGPNVTFCSCNNECGPIDVFEDFVSTNDYTISPNPISENSVLTFYNPIESYHQLVIYDLYGRVAKTQEGIYSNEININRSGLKRGIYFFKIMSSYNVKAAGKLVVN